MKTAIELISDLDAGAKKRGTVLLVVGFPKQTRVVPSSFSDRLQLLEYLLQQGGIPVGMVSRDTVDGEEHAFYYILEDRVADEWAQPYVEAFVDRLMTAEPGELISEAMGIEDFKV